MNIKTLIDLWKQGLLSTEEFKYMKSINRIWNKIDKKSDNECWNWKCGLSGVGYGSCWFMGKRTNPTRVIWEFVNGKSIPEGLWVLHSCNNPKCCNPAHLRVGTPKDNTQDMIKSGNHLYYDGSSKRSKLNPKQTHELHKLYTTGNYTQKELGVMFGVHMTTVGSILKHYK